jgi:nucleoside-diphosphate-sugar epimerase
MGSLIAITGATGFAGRHTVPALLARGHRLRALVRRPAVAGLPPGVEVVAGGLDDLDALAALVRGADAVVHVAGAIAAVDRSGYFAVNDEGTAALANAALNAGTHRLIHISSLAARAPQVSPYGASKRAGEERVKALMQPLNAIVLRPPAVYGPGDRATLPLFAALSRPVTLIPGRRGARFSLLHVSDLARMIADSVESSLQGIHEVSDGTPGGYGWPELLAVAERVSGRRVRAVFLPRAVPQAVALAAEAAARIRGRPGMVNRGKIAELYEPDWVSGETGIRVAKPITFAAGFPATLSWYQDAGWLPRAAGADTSGTTSDRTLS